MANLQAPKGRSRDSARYQQIVDAAAEVFYAKGYAGTSTQDIADRAGILKGSLYHYISAKEDLLLAVMTRVYEDLVALATEVMAADLDPVAKLRRLIREQIEYNAANRATTGVYYAEFRWLEGERRQQIVGMGDRIEEILRGLITAAQKQRRIRRDVDPKLVGFVMLGAINWFHEWYRPEGEKSAAQLAETMADLLLSGALTSP
jgi:AcrR family transcriptional regulator